MLQFVELSQQKVGSGLTVVLVDLSRLQTIGLGFGQLVQSVICPSRVKVGVKIVRGIKRNTGVGKAKHVLARWHKGPLGRDRPEGRLGQLFRAWAQAPRASSGFWPSNTHAAGYSASASRAASALVSRLSFVACRHAEIPFEPALVPSTTEPPRWEHGPGQRPQETRLIRHDRKICPCIGTCDPVVRNWWKRTVDNGTRLFGGRTMTCLSGEASRTQRHQRDDQYRR
jgi:hypothetical protein